jgi:ATP-dependent Clp protease ATP-binding subunit ClpA
MDRTFPMPEATNFQSELDDDDELQDVTDHPSEVEAVSPVEELSPVVIDILAAATEVAGRRGHALVTADDLFAALISSDCAATRTLESIGMQGDRLLEQLAFILGRNNHVEKSSVTGRSPRVEQILGSARMDAGRRGAQSVDSLHLLSAILRERNGVPSLLLETPGLGLEPVGAALNRALREGTTDPS